MPERRPTARKLPAIACVCLDETACCTAVRTDPVDPEAVADLAGAMRALGDPTRVALVQMLHSAEGPVCVVDIERHLPLAQSTVSYHLKALVDVGLLDRERRGKWSYYTVQTDRLAQLAAALGDLSGAGT